MNDRPVCVVLGALERTTGRRATRNGSCWTAHCPAHDDKRPSLTISEGDDGHALIHCHAGCTAEAIVKALGLTLRDLMPPRMSRSSRPKVPAKPRPVLPRSGARNGKARTQKVFKTVAGAVTDLEKRHGLRSALWEYRDADGNPIGMVVRWDTKRDKDIRPVSRTPAGWIIGGMPAPRPLYQLPELIGRPDERVVITEGERAADAAAELGYLATTSAHGSKSADKADWSPLAGREVVILPDADDAGEQYAKDVAAILEKLDPPAEVLIMLTSHSKSGGAEIPCMSLPEKGDIADWVEQYRKDGHDEDAMRQDLEALIAQATVAATPPASRAGSFQPFPVDVLPEPLRSFVTTAAQAIGCDPSYLVLPLLAALAAAIGNTRRIELKRGWSEPAIVWAVIVGESGTLKTPAFRLVLRSLRDMQAKALRSHAAKVEDFTVELLRYEKELSAWKRSKGNCDPPARPQPSPAIRFVVGDTTIEALAPILLENPRGVLVARDEISGWFGSFGRYTGGRTGADEAHWLSMHGGESITVDRKTGTPRTIHVPSASVSVTGGIQPRVLDRALGAGHRESGLLARLLLAMPPRRPKQWTEVEISPQSEAKLREVIERLHELDFVRNTDGDPQAVILSMTPKAKDLWGKFYNEHAKEQVDLSGDLSAAWSKLEAYAARIALVVHCVRWATRDPALSDADKVDEVSIAAGITMTRWFGGEDRRVYRILAENDEEHGRRQLVEWIERRGGIVTVRELTHGWHHYRGRADAAKADLDALVQAGFGDWIHQAPGSKGGRPSRPFVLNTASPITKTPTGDATNGGFGCGDAEDTPTELSQDDLTREAPDDDTSDADSDATPGENDDGGEV